MVHPNATTVEPPIAPRRRLLRVVCVLALLTAAFGIVEPADAAKKTTKKSKAASRAVSAKQVRVTLGDLRRTKAEREKVRTRARAASKKVNALKASQSKVSRQLESAGKRAGLAQAEVFSLSAIVDALGTGKAAPSSWR